MSRAVTNDERLAFIDRMYPYAVKAYSILGKVRPSVCIAMMITESATGTSKYAEAPYNSFLGQKRGTGKTATKYWSGQSFSAKTQECYDQASGQLTTIKDSFRMYDSPEECVMNYYELLNTRLYKGVTDCDPWNQIQQIKDCGYFTSTTEVNTVRALIKQYDLERFDKLNYDNDMDKVVPGPSTYDKLGGVVDLCKYMWIDESYDHRAQIAAQLGITGYKGSAEQNQQLMHMIAVRCLNAACEVLGR